MSYYDTIHDDIERAKAILLKGRPEETLYRDYEGKMLGGTIFGADIYAAYKLLESFVGEVESYLLLLALMDADDYKAAVLKWKARRDEITSFHGLFSDYEEPCESFAQAQAIWNAMKDREATLRHAIGDTAVYHMREVRELEQEVTRLRALVDAVGEATCKTALRLIERQKHP